MSRQDLTLEKEQARLKMKADANFQRNLRYKDSRLRTIGINLNALDQQVAEKKAMKQKEIEDGKLERARNAEIDYLLELAAQEEKEMRAKLNRDMRFKWEEAIQHKKDQVDRNNDADDKQLGDRTFTFGGEDLLATERKKAMQEQMKRWTQEASDAAAYRKQKDRDEEAAYADMIRSIEDIREQCSAEEDEMRKDLIRKVVAENDIVAAEVRARKEAEDMKRKEVSGNSINLDTSSHGKDTFRGFTKEHQLELLRENEKILAEKRERDEAYKRSEEDWYREQLRQQRLMAQAAAEEEMMRKELNAKLLNDLEDQKRDAEERAAEARSQRYAKNSGDFYKNFGTSCR